MTSSKDKVHQFMESPLVAWARTFDDMNTVDTVEDLADGILLNKIMNTVDPSNYSMSKVNRSNVANDHAARLQNLQLLVTRIKHFYLTALQQLIITGLPRIAVISADPSDDLSLDELEKLLVLLLGCVVQCEGKVPLIERMKSMNLTQQQALVVHIQQMTDTTDYVCSIDWNDLGEISRNNLEGLCRTAYLHLQRVAKERDGHYDVLLDTMMERDYYRQVHDSTDGNESLPRENGLPLPSTPVRSPSINTEILEVKKKNRMIQEQLDHKTLQLSEAREELERAQATVQRLQQEKQELAGEAKAARMYRDEIETLKVQSARVEKLEADVRKYRQKAEDTEYLRKRIADLKQQNELMLETKSLLEQKAASLTAKADTVDDLQTELVSLRAQVESLGQEKEMYTERVEELMGQLTHVELDNKHCQEQIEELSTMLEAEREKSDVAGTGEASNLSFEMSEADLASKAKVLRLEKEARELEKTTELLRQSQAKAVELEKANKKLYSQTHTDRKEIIKLREEVEVLRVKASRVDKLQVELNSQRERLEEATRAHSKLKEFKTRNEAATQAKVRLEDEVESLMSKLAQLNDIRDESASLKAQIDSFTSKHSDDEKRIQELLEQNAQLELENQRSSEEIVVLQSQLEAERARSSSGSQTTVTVVSPPRLSEAEMASRAKLQRLEKERREMEKTIEGFRKSQAKLTELERTNKKLQEQTHTDRRESIRLKEELQIYKTRAERLNKLQSAMRSQEHKLEDMDAAMKKITELKQQNALLSETKVLLQDEVSDLHSRLERLNDVQAENSALKVRVESQETELREEGLRMQELLQQNVQLELDRDRKMAEMGMMQTEIIQLKLDQPTRDEVPFSPAGLLFSEQDLVLQTKLLHLERDKRDLEQSLQMLKCSQERVDGENQNTKQKLTEQIHDYRKEVAKLREELRREKSQVESLHTTISRMKSAEVTDQDQRQAKQMQELESRFNEAYSQSLSMKDERILVLERRLEDLSGDNEQLKDEASLLKRQNERLQRRNSASSPSAAFGRSFSPREMTRLKEEAAEAHRLKQGVQVLQQENHSLKADVEEARVYIERCEATNERMQDRLQMLEQLNHTLDEEKKILMDQMNKVLAHNQDLLMRTLDSKDQAIEEERMFNDRLGELERDKVRLSEQLVAQQREQLVREMDVLKRSKSKNLLKKGFKKLKGKIQGRTHVFEHTEFDASQMSPSHAPLGLPSYSLQDGSMSSNQSISSSNSGREVDTHEETEATAEGTTAGLIPRGPTLNESPSMRKKRSNTMPSMVKLRHPPASSSPRGMPGISEDLMSLEDFLAESDKTPNRRRVMELKRASLILNTPPVTPRNSLLVPLSAGPSGGHGERMFDLQDFLAQGFKGDVRQSITEVDEMERPLSSQTATEFQSQGSGLSSQGLSQGLSSQGLSGSLSQHSDGKSATELNLGSNTNSNNSNNNSNYDGVIALEPAGSTLLNESIMSMEDILAEFDVVVGATAFSYAPSPSSSSGRDGETRLTLPPLDNSTTSQESSVSNRPASSEQSMQQSLSVQHQRQHSRSFNSGLNRLNVPTDTSRQSQTLPKSVSSDNMLAESGKGSKTKKGKGKDKAQKEKGASWKRKKQAKQHRSTEVLSSGKPPSGKPPKKHKLLLEPRGPLYSGGGEVDTWRHSTALDSSHFSELTSIHHRSEAAGTEEDTREKELKRLSLRPVAADGDETFTLSDFLQPQLSPPDSDDKSFWHEYGQI